MCGICGKINFNGEGIERALLKAMTGSLIHRGPDEEGYYLEGPVGLGARRLSIIDLQTGSQPIPNEDGTKWVIENGEIYNFLSLRDECRLRGHNFRTNTDTEISVHLYEDFGEGFVKYIKGMFSVAIYDKEQKKLLIARDRVGIKPLFYYKDKDTFVFASELKAILKDPGVKLKFNLQAFYNFLSLKYIPAPLTIYENIFKLEAGHLLVCDLEKANIETKQYWDLPDIQKKLTEKQACAELMERLKEAVSRQLISDVPLGVFLSGGTDSSALVALMGLVGKRPIETFSIGFEEESFNELPYARIVAKHFNTKHHEFIVKPVNLRELIPKLALQFDEPFADSSLVPVNFVSKLARDSGVKTVFSGEGGDEAFGGYFVYAGYRLLGLYQGIPGPLQLALSYIIRSLPASSKKASLDYMAKRFIEGARLTVPAEVHCKFGEIFSQDAISELLSGKYAGGRSQAFEIFRGFYSRRKSPDSLNAILYIDLKSYLADDLLVKVDRMSMLNSLEARVPFLDEGLIEFMAGLPSAWKVKFLKKKYLFRKVMRGILPAVILNRRKKGFSIPAAKWIKGELKDMVTGGLRGTDFKQCPLINHKTVSWIIEKHMRNEKDLSRQIWSLFIFSLWYGENKKRLSI